MRCGKRKSFILSLLAIINNDFQCISLLNLSLVNMKFFGRFNYLELLCFDQIVILLKLMLALIQN